MSEIYLDNHTITKPSDKVLSAMMPYFSDYWGSFSAYHKKGQELSDIVIDSYKDLYNFFGADKDDTILITSSTQESSSQVFFSTYSTSTIQEGKSQYIISQNDELATIHCAQHYEQLGCSLKKAPLNNIGQVTKEAVFDLVTPMTALISLPLANGLMGVLQPVEEIAEICQERGILLHLDASHVIGKQYLDLKELKADFISFSGDLIHAPKGCAGLYIKKGTEIKPLIFGGSDQGGFRGGNLNIPGLVALSLAVKEAEVAKDYFCTEIARLRCKLEVGLLEGLKDSEVLFQGVERLPSISVISFPGIYNETLLFHLNNQGIFATCGGGNFQPLDKALTNMGVDQQLANSAISFGLSLETTEAEIDQAVKIITFCVKELYRGSLK